MDTSELIELFGKNIDSNEVNDFLKKYPSFKIDRPDCGTQYVESKEEGVDLLFEPDDGAQGGKTKHLRNCQSIFLYSQGMDDHEQYSGKIPLGFIFSDSRQALINKSTPERTWKIGKGEVEVSFPNPSHDRWDLGDKYLSAHYSKKTGAIMYFIFSRKKA
ncbi:hypothetical protein [Pseudoalteromonas sp. SR45-4]|uniref:hypothetical protein n=1 Tax=Pseudoalteromonas TaxID=53246 RepID=UPI0015F90088|nr:hypothetical protein [Pseudoalteromonas sp. SR45-4]MBB1372371.1 hypothetical protein [Pseudoalteromonas sp. SR45-4]